jgi:tryptophanase
VLITVVLTGEGKSLGGKPVSILIEKIDHEIIRIDCITDYTGKCVVNIPLNPAQVVSVSAVFSGDEAYSPASDTVHLAKCVGSTGGFIRAVTVIKKYCQNNTCGGGSGGK